MASSAIVVIVAALIVSIAMVAVVALLRVEPAAATMVVAAAVEVATLMRVVAIAPITAFPFHHFVATTVKMTVLATLPSRSLAVVSLGVTGDRNRPVCILHRGVLLASHLILPHLVADLASGASTAELTMGFEAVVPVDANDASIED